ncbi:hypothetical protein FHG87_017169, partial [Trinorchestia longiramus]
QVRQLLELCQYVYPINQAFKEHRWEIRKFLAGPNTTKLLLAVEKISSILCKTFRNTYTNYHPGVVNFFEQMYCLRKGLLFLCVEFYTPNKFNVQCAAEQRWLLRLEKRFYRRLKYIRIIMNIIFVTKANSLYSSYPCQSCVMATAFQDFSRDPPQEYLLRKDSSKSFFPRPLKKKFHDHADATEFFRAQRGPSCSYCKEKDFLNENENFIIVANCPHLYCHKCFRYLKRGIDSRCCLADCSQEFLMYSDRRSFDIYKSL